MEKLSYFEYYLYSILKFNEEERKLIVDIGKNWAKKKNWIDYQNSLYRRLVETVQDDTKTELLMIKKGCRFFDCKVFFLFLSPFKLNLKIKL